MIQITLLRYQHVPRVRVPSQVSLLPTRSSRWTMGSRQGQNLPSYLCQCALQQSIERDKERTVNIMNLIVSDKQRWNFNTPSWIVALYSMYEFCELGRSGDQCIELNFTRSPGTRFLDSRFKHSPLCFTLSFLIRLITLIEQFKTIVVIPQLNRVMNGHLFPWL